MANQPPSRPWFRLTNLSRQPPTPAPAPPPQQQQPPPPPSPQQQPRIPIIRPSFRPTFSQAQPPPPPPSPPQSRPPFSVASSRTPSQPQSPATPPPPPFPISSPSPPRVAASPPYVSPSPMPAMTSARSLESFPPQSSSVKSPTPSPPSPKSPQFTTPRSSPITTTRSPPPISLPPPQLNSSSEPRSLPQAEQEKVLLQETFNKKVVFPSSDGNSFKGHNKSSKYGRKPDSGSDDGKNVRIITMTGENKGALMELGFPDNINMHGHGGKRLGTFSDSDHNVGNDSDGGNADRSKAKDNKGMPTAPRLPMSGYVNSNVQGINNSIIYNCSFTHHDPGVHFSLSRKPVNAKAQGNGHGIHQKHLANGKQL